MGNKSKQADQIDNPRKDPELNEVPYMKGNQVIHHLPKPRPWLQAVKKWWNEK